MTSAHAAARISERLTAEDTADLVRRLDTFAAEHPVGTYAVRALSLAAMRGTAWSAASNGDTVVAIVRDGTVATVMLRRSSQPFDRAAFNVQRLADIR